MKPTVILGCWLSLVASAAEVVTPLTLDPAQSSLTLTLLVTKPPFYLSNTQTQALTGTLTLSTRWQPLLSSATLEDFDWRAAANYSFSLGFGITAGLTNLVVRHACPGSGQPAAPVGFGWITFENVPYRLSGWVGYLAVEPGCSLLTNTSFGCQGTVDLAPRGTRPWETFPGSLLVISNRLCFDGTFRFNVPIDEANPDLGSVIGYGVVRASGPVQPPLWIEWAGTYHILRWPAVFANFIVERSTGGPPPWTWTEAFPFFTANDGWVNTALLDTEELPALFYRLKEVPASAPHPTY